MTKAAKPLSLTSLREKPIKGREGRQPWPLLYIPNGRGRGIAADVRRNPVADHRAAGAARTGVTGRWTNTTNETAEVRLDQGRISILALSAIDRPFRTV
jgi:hypothetical protein